MSEITLPKEPLEATFGDVVYNPGGKCGPRRQTRLQFFLLHTGGATLSVKGKQPLELPVQYAALMLPEREEFYQFSQQSATHHSWCCLYFDPITPGLRRIFSELPTHQPVTRWMQEWVKLGVSLERSNAGSAKLLLKLGEALFYEYAAAALRGGASPGQSWPATLDRAHEFLERHYSEKIDLACWAAASATSVNHLIRLFRKHLGETPSHYLWRYRTEQGLALLRETGLSISEIAYRVGFQTPFHFSRLVRHYQHLPPSELRARELRRQEKHRPIPPGRT
jgi:AraC family transcriptional regulator of arabinose operon